MFSNSLSGMFTARKPGRNTTTAIPPVTSPPTQDLDVTTPTTTRDRPSIALTGTTLSSQPRRPSTITIITPNPTIDPAFVPGPTYTHIRARRRSSAAAAASHLAKKARGVTSSRRLRISRRGSCSSSASCSSSSTSVDDDGVDAVREKMPGRRRSILAVIMPSEGVRSPVVAYKPPRSF